MHLCAADIQSLTLLIQRILDAELLLEEEGAALLAQTGAAGRSLEAGDGPGARRHLERLAQLTEALVATDALALADGQAVIEPANRLLARDA